MSLWPVGTRIGIALAAGEAVAFRQATNDTTYD
jgi:hypothetical protein